MTAGSAAPPRRWPARASTWPGTPPGSAVTARYCPGITSMPGWTGTGSGRTGWPPSTRPARTRWRTAAGRPASSAASARRWAPRSRPGRPGPSCSRSRWPAAARRRGPRKPRRRGRWYPRRRSRQSPRGARRRVAAVSPRAPFGMRALGARRRWAVLRPPARRRRRSPSDLSSGTLKEAGCVSRVTGISRAPWSGECEGPDCPSPIRRAFLRTRGFLTRGERRRERRARLSTWNSRFRICALPLTCGTGSTLPCRAELM